MPKKAKGEQGKKAKSKKAQAQKKTQARRARSKAKDARVEGEVGVKRETVVVAVAPAKEKKTEAGGKADGGDSGGGGSRGKGALIAAALGVAAAAAAGVAAFKTLAGKKRKVFHLMPHEDGWQVTRAGKETPESVHGRKRKARSEARDLARANEPSQLVIHRADGTIQTVHTYGE